jgi:uncharacterized protein
MKEAMAVVVIIHGTYGKPTENWFPWLADELRRRGVTVFVPSFPTPENQSPETWHRAFDQQVKVPAGKRPILIGHSLGAGFILDLLQDYDLHARAVFLASGFTGQLGLKDFDPLNNAFVNRTFDWSLIRERAGDIHIYHGDNDPYVPLEKARDLARELHVTPTILKSGGHLNASAGYTSFPALLKDVLYVLDGE